MKSSESFRQPVALVLSSEINGLGVIRSLGMENVPVFALDPNPLAVGLYSKYAKKITCPDPLQSEDAFIQFIIRIGQDLKVPGILFPTTDIYVAALAKAREQLGPLFKIPFAPWEVIKRIVNKGEQYELAKGAGIPIPQTFTPKSVQQAREVGTTLRYPVILKPVYSHPFVVQYWIKGKNVHTAEELVHQYETYYKAGHPMLIQEMIQGDIDRLYEFSSYLSPTGELLGSFVQRKLEQYPADFGTGTLFESAHDTNLSDLGLRVLKAFGFYGLSNIEFKKDPSDGQFKMIELNPRTTHANFLSTACGMNLPYLVYQDMGGKVNRRMPPLCEGKWVFAEQRLFKQRKWPFLKKKNGRASSMIGYNHAIFSYRDPLPEAIFFYAALKRLLKRTLKRIGLK